MKKNYLKTYFKAFGFLATLLVIVIFALVGLVIFEFDKFSFLAKNVAISNAVIAGVIAIVVGGAVVGLSGLRNEKVCMTDFVRISFFVSSIVLAVLGLLSKHNTDMIIFFALAGVFLIEIIVRCTAITNDQAEVGMKAYFSALGYRFNPILIVLCGVVCAVGFALLGKFELLDKVNDSKYATYWLLGGGISLVAVLLISAMDKESDANFLDFLLAILFIGLLYSPVLLAGYLTRRLVSMLLVLIALVTAALIIRAVFYNKDIVYDNQRHKAKTYYRNIFSHYNVLFALLVAVVTVALVTAAIILVGPSCTLKQMFASRTPAILEKFPVYIFGGAAALIVLLLLLLVFAFRGFSSTEPVKTDWVLIALISATGVSLSLLAGAFVNNNFSLLTDNIVLLALLGVFALLFVVGIILQIIRIRNFDPMAAIIALEAEQRMNEKKEAKQAQKEAEEKAAKEAEEAKPYDPFALTEEDEAIYEAEYGSDEKEEEEEQGNPYEEEQEEVVEEVVEEEPQEETTTQSEDDEFDAFLNSVPDASEKQEEAPAEEEVVEEAVEETPAPVEESKEEATLDEDDAEEDEDDTDEDEAEEEEAEEADEEPAEPHEYHKEADIEVTEFVAVDEDGQPRKIKRKFNTKMMFAPYETKEYYNEIKNYLMMYRAKGRYSSRCESFRYKGLVAKLALGGKAIKVFLALDPSIIEQYPKYHLKDVSEKKQYAEVPVCIKVRSDRALKYCKELIDLMFANRLVKPKRNFEPTNFVPQLIPNGEAILGNLGMSTYYLQNTMNVNGIPDEMPDDLIEYLPMIHGEPLDEEEEEAVAYLDTLCLHFEDGDEVTLDVLKSMHVCQKGNILRIKARGTLDRKLIIYAEEFEEDALKMIMCTNGTAVRIVRD